jgi:hypothetical protein
MVMGIWLQGYSYGDCCRELFKELKTSTVMTVYVVYILSVLLLIVNNRDYFVSNTVMYIITSIPDKQ